MSEFEKEDYVKYRLEKAHEALDAAQVLLQNKLWNSVVNRLYYACFYAVNALLVQDGINAQTHTGVKTQFFLFFVKIGKVSKTLGKLYADLFDGRQKGDYNDFYDFEEEPVVLLHQQSVEFINKINELVKSSF